MISPGDSCTWRAPGRVNLIGEHTDYNDGFALPLAIAEGCTATATVRGDRTLHIRSAQASESASVELADLRPETVEGWAAYVAGVIWALAERGVSAPGLDIAVDGDVPLGSGLSSSAALSCSAASAVNDLLGLELNSADLVELARICENDFVGAPTGGMDQLASIRSEAGHVLLCDMRSLDTRAVPMDLAAAGLTLLVTDTKAPHQHADGEYRARREACEQAAGLLGIGSLREVQDDDHHDVLDRLRKAAEAATDGDDGDVLVRRTRHILTENDRVLSGGRAARRRGCGRDRFAAHCIAPFDARRLRDHGGRGGHRRRLRSRRGRARCADDRRRVRGLRHRAHPNSLGPGRDVCYRASLRGQGFHPADLVRGHPVAWSAPPLAPPEPLRVSW